MVNRPGRSRRSTSPKIRHARGLIPSTRERTGARTSPEQSSHQPPVWRKKKNKYSPLQCLIIFTHRCEPDERIGLNFHVRNIAGLFEGNTAFADDFISEVFLEQFVPSAGSQAACYPRITTFPCRTEKDGPLRYFWKSSWKVVPHNCISTIIPQRCVSKRHIHPRIDKTSNGNLPHSPMDYGVLG